MAEHRVLHSWKEIASYTGKGVRTLQRYEAHFGFPVRRPSGKNRSSVLAFSDEVDSWLSGAPTRAHELTELQVQIRTQQLAVIAAAKQSKEAAIAAYEAATAQAARVEDLLQKLQSSLELLPRADRSSKPSSGARP